MTPAERRFTTACKALKDSCEELGVVMPHGAPSDWVKVLLAHLKKTVTVIEAIDTLLDEGDAMTAIVVERR